MSARAPFYSFDPRSLIRPPFERCPGCGCQQFGVLLVHGDAYTRRCSQCWHDADYALPRLRKTVIYLDQHLISNMMKSLNPTVDPARAKRAAFARPIFEVLDRAAKLQLIVCPSSHTHERESMVGPDFTALRWMFEHLAHGLVFLDEEDIEAAQVLQHAGNWLAGAPDRPQMLDAQDVVDGDLHGWQHYLRFAVPWEPSDDEIAQLRSRRVQLQAGLEEWLRRWATISDTTFDVYRREKITAFGRHVIDTCRGYSQRRLDMAAGQSASIEEEPPASLRLFERVHRSFAAEGLPSRVAWQNAREYFESGQHDAIPHVRLDALLCAALVWKVAHGTKRAVGPGTLNDLNTIACLLPYCSAMYIDNQMYGLLTESHVARQLGVPTRLFCNRTKADFVAYVEGLIADAAPEHLATVRGVYGEAWGQPFTTMYGGPVSSDPDE